MKPLLICLKLLCMACMTMQRELASGSPKQRGHSDRVHRDVDKNSIPHILHHVFLNGNSEFKRLSEAGHMNHSYYDSCKAAHPGWEQMFWEEGTARDLVQTKFPWFLTTYDEYSAVVMKGDTLRYMLMYVYGGLYLDVDVECLSPADNTLTGMTIALQGTGQEGVTNAVLASAPGNQFWINVLKLCQQRAPKNSAYNDPIMQTGPGVVTAAVQSFFHFEKVMAIDGGGYSGYEVEEPESGTKLKVYPIGDWFNPCWFSGKSCWRHFVHGLRAGSWDFSNLVGVHWFAGSWNG